MIVERIENGIAVLESGDGRMLKIEASLLDSRVREGDVIFFDGSLYQTDPEATMERKKRIKEKMLAFLGQTSSLQ